MNVIQFYCKFYGNVIAISWQIRGDVTHDADRTGAERDKNVAISQLRLERRGPNVAILQLRLEKRSHNGTNSAAMAVPGQCSQPPRGNLESSGDDEKNDNIYFLMNVRAWYRCTCGPLGVLDHDAALLAPLFQLPGSGRYDKTANYYAPSTSSPTICAASHLDTCNYKKQCQLRPHAWH